MVTGKINSLTYRVTSDPTVMYENPESLNFRNLFGQFELAEGVLVVYPEEPFQQYPEGREIVESFLQDWTIFTNLREGRGMIGFEFVSQDIAPDANASGNLEASGSIVSFSSSATGFLSRRNYPRPPTEFSANKVVQVAERRWSSYRAGKEPLPAAAYAILTLLCRPSGYRECASRLRVDVDVLRKLSELSSTRGGEDSARKFGVHELSPLSDRERAWLERVVPLLILRVGECAAGASVAQLGMLDLPEL